MDKFIISYFKVHKYKEAFNWRSAKYFATPLYIYSSLFWWKIFSYSLTVELWISWKNEKYSEFSNFLWSFSSISPRCSVFDNWKFFSFKSQSPRKCCRSKSNGHAKRPRSEENRSNSFIQFIWTGTENYLFRADKSRYIIHALRERPRIFRFFFSRFDFTFISFVSFIVVLTVAEFQIFLW